MTPCIFEEVEGGDDTLLYVTTGPLIYIHLPIDHMYIDEIEHFINN